MLTNVFFGQVLPSTNDPVAPKPDSGYARRQANSFSDHMDDRKNTSRAQNPAKESNSSTAEASAKQDSKSASTTSGTDKPGNNVGASGAADQAGSKSVRQGESKAPDESAAQTAEQSETEVVEPEVETAIPVNAEEKHPEVAVLQVGQNAKTEALPSDVKSPQSSAGANIPLGRTAVENTPVEAAAINDEVNSAELEPAKKAVVETAVKALPENQPDNGAKTASATAQATVPSDTNAKSTAIHVATGAKPEQASELSVANVAQAGSAESVGPKLAQGEQVKSQADATRSASSVVNTGTENRGLTAESVKSAKSGEPTLPDSVDGEEAGTDAKSTVEANRAQGAVAAATAVAAGQAGAKQGATEVETARKSRGRDSESSEPSKSAGDTGKTVATTAAQAINQISAVQQAFVAQVQALGAEQSGASGGQADALLMGGDAALDTPGLSQLLTEAVLQPGTVHRPEIPRLVAVQLAEAFAAKGERNVEVALNPEELGRVKMRVSTSENGIIVVIQTERPETGDLMRRHINELADEFRKMGFENISFEFNGGNASGGQAENNGSNQAGSGAGGTETSEEMAAASVAQTAVQNLRLGNSGVDMRV